ncbi:MAG: hypothetical protein MUO60_04945, partial [Clostridiaceae bacterium]|nr:hypothetical protein [Clostridiaceae bacterium]
YKKFDLGINVTDKSKVLPNNTTSTENNKVSDQNVEKSPPGTLNEEAKKSSTYLPTLNKKYTYYNKYVDGDECAVDVWVGHIEGVPLMSMSNIIPQSEVFTEHIVKRDDGIYLIADYNPEIYIKYLPSEILEGASWEMDGISFKIEEINVSCNMGFKTFENCIVVKQDFAQAGYNYKVWYAPGVGVVKSVYADSGGMYQKLTGISDMKESEVKELLLKYSANIDKIK